MEIMTTIKSNPFTETKPGGFSKKRFQSIKCTEQELLFENGHTL